MANVTITQLPAAQALTGTELVPVVQNGQTVRTTTGAIGGGGGSGSVTSVDVSGGTTGLTTTGGPITSTGTITLGGTLAVGSGGTGGATAATARANILPSYAGNESYVLRVNAGATDVEWSAAGSGGGVVSVTGTANEINSTGGITPVLSLPGSLVFTGKTIAGGAFSGGTIDNMAIGATTPAVGRFSAVNSSTGTITATPVGNNDIVNKAYADAVASGLTFHQNCDFATSDFLPDCTYNNGSSGVGATLTAISNGALLIDSSTIVAGNRVLVKNQSAQLQNGIYTVTQVGTVSTPFILTRATDYDTPGTTYLNVDAGDFTLILSGATNANTSWVQTTLQPITIGTTSLVFVQFGSGIAVYSNGTGLSLSGTNQFSITNTGVTSATYGSATQVPQIAVNAQGQITGAINTAIAINGNQVTTGTVAISQGGTGKATAADAINALLPSQTSNSGKFLTTNGTSASWGSAGTVTSVSVVSANGLAGSVATASSTPAITLSTTVTGLLKGNGTAISAATANTDYQSPVALTTIGTSGAATFNGTTLNIPNYATGGSPGGSDTQIQFNNKSAFGGSANLTWNGSSVQVGGQGSVRFGDLDNSNWVAFRAPSVVGTNVTWTLPSTGGTAGQLLSTDASNNLSWITATGTGTVTSVGQSFTGGIVSVAGSPVTTTGSFDLTVTGTSGGIVYFSGANTWASSAVLAANALVVGGGAGAAPSTVTTGTGVVTALGVNTGTAGAFVVNGGALGTPISGTVTNLTGTASININGTVGATTPTTGVFTTATARAAATQDSVILQGRAGGTGSFGVTLTPTTLTASRTLTLPDASGTILQSGTAVTVGQGGTGIQSGTSGGVPYFSSTSAIASSAALASNALVVGGGAGAAPATVTTGTGVLTFLGTPSSANLLSAMTDDTGTGLLVFNSAPALTNPTVTNYTETNFTATVTGNAITLSLTNGTFQTITTMVGANAITLPAPATGKSLTVFVVYASTPTSLTFSSPSGTLKYPGGTTPTATLTNTKVDIYAFMSDGTNWYGIQSGANF